MVVPPRSLRASALSLSKIIRSPWRSTVRWLENLRLFHRMGMGERHKGSKDPCVTVRSHFIVRLMMMRLLRAALAVWPSNATRALSTRQEEHFIIKITSRRHSEEMLRTQTLSWKPLPIGAQSASSEIASRKILLPVWFLISPNFLEAYTSSNPKTIWLVIG